MWTRGIISAILFLVIAGGCARKPDKMVVVVTTIPVLSDWVEQIGGERVAVFSLLKGQEEPHSYEPKPQDGARIARAKLVVRVGLGLDEWLNGLIVSAGGTGVKILTLADGVDLIRDSGDEHGVHEQGNPHIWLDPAVAKAGVRRIAAALIEIDPAGRGYYQQRAERYIRQLDSASTELKGAVQELNNRRFVAMHNSWPYFCRAFGFELVAAVEPVPGQEPSARTLAGLIKRMREDSVRVIVIEPQHNPEVANMLARETGAQVITLCQFNRVLAGTDSYLQLLDYDVRTLINALKRAGAGQKAE
ncbi:MAG: metal ABC transporter substrate-binding protein [candidate division WOR-3 bacterium]